MPLESQCRIPVAAQAWVGLNDTATLTLVDATLATGGFSDTLGALTLGDGPSTLDFGNGASLLHVAPSDAQPWTGTLTILNGTDLTLGDGAGQLFVGAGPTALTPAQLARLTFLDPANKRPGLYEATLLPTGELIPEPGSLGLLVGVVFLGLRRPSSTCASSDSAVRSKWRLIRLVGEPRFTLSRARRRPTVHPAIPLLLSK